MLELVWNGDLAPIGPGSGVVQKHAVGPLVSDLQIYGMVNVGCMAGQVQILEPRKAVQRLQLRT